MTDRLLLTEQEAAEQLLMHPRTLRKLRQAGEIRYVALAGRKIGYRPEDCRAYVEARVNLAVPYTAPRGKSTRPTRGGNNVVSFTARRRERVEARGRL